MRRPTMTKQVEQYLTLRRAMGFDLLGEGYQLHAFARFAEETGHAGPLTTDLLLRWVQAAKKPGPVTAAAVSKCYVHFSNTVGSSILLAQYFHWGFAVQLIGGSHHTSTQKRKLLNCLPLLANSSPMECAH